MYKDGIFLEVSCRATESPKSNVDDYDYTKNVVIQDLQCERLYWADSKILKFPIIIFLFLDINLIFLKFHSNNKNSVNI